MTEVAEEVKGPQPYKRKHATYVNKRAKLALMKALELGPATLTELRERLHHPHKTNTELAVYLRTLRRKGIVAAEQIDKGRGRNILFRYTLLRKVKP